MVSNLCIITIRTDIFGEGQTNKKLQELIKSKKKLVRRSQFLDFTSAHVIVAAIIQKKYMQIKFK